MEKNLRDLIACIKVRRTLGDLDRTITDVVNDSRKATPGSLFIAVKGVAVDSHRFIPDVVRAGAVAVVCQELPAEPDPAVAYIEVPDSTVALAYLASAWFDEPSRHLRLVGVTGTNGKTTIATLLYELATLMGYKAGLLSTVENIVAGTHYAAVQTTPDHLSLNRLLHEMVQAGCDYAFMEVSSIATVQHRTDGLTFAGGIFTNLTRDHLDFHKTMQNYALAKKMFFDSLPADAFALVNADDKQGAQMVTTTRARVCTYSLRAVADYRARVIEDRLDGTTVSINGHELETLFTGRFNVYNLLAVFGAALQLGLPADEVLVKLSLLRPVNGRFQTFVSPRGYTAVVDFAHTPDALVNVLSAIAEVQQGRGRIITVCGCGGHRDKGKRPMMAAEAAARSSFVILTSDNPRDEDPWQILLDMDAGLTDETRQRTTKVPDRREAITMACRMAQPGDVVLVAGKGHESYQEVRGVKHHFSDQEEIKRIFDSEK